MSFPDGSCQAGAADTRPKALTITCQETESLSAEQEEGGFSDVDAVD